MLLFLEQKEPNSGMLLLQAVRYQEHICFVRRPIILCVKEGCRFLNQASGPQVYRLSTFIYSKRPLIQSPLIHIVGYSDQSSSNVHIFLWHWMLINLYRIWCPLLNLDSHIFLTLIQVKNKIILQVQ